MIPPLAVPFPVRTLAKGMLANHHLELPDELGMSAELEVGVNSLLEAG